MEMETHIVGTIAMESNLAKSSKTECAPAQQHFHSQIHMVEKSLKQSQEQGFLVWDFFFS